MKSKKQIEEMMMIMETGYADIIYDTGDENNTIALQCKTTIDTLNWVLGLESDLDEIELEALK